MVFELGHSVFLTPTAGSIGARATFAVAAGSIDGLPAVIFGGRATFAVPARAFFALGCRLFRRYS